jgi:molecular chaperone DnaK
MKPIAGIDLGTTYSSLAVLTESGRPEVVPNLAGDRLTPSAVWFPEGEAGVARVGAEAKQMVQSQSSRVVQFVKRHMGEPSYRFKIDGREWSPVEISALILRKLREECLQYGEATDAVITVPAHFDEIPRKSTMDAGQLAGLNVLGLINEPTAAALYYATSHQVEGHVLVFDLGGGTFDVTILSARGPDVRILSSKGDGYLGGLDFDRAIVRHYSEQYRAAQGAPLLPESMFAHRSATAPPDEATLELYHKLLDLAEKDKRVLTARPEVSRTLATSAGPLRVTLTREHFEEMISTYVAKAEMLVENALEDAKLRPGDVGATLLVGGSSRIPVFARSLERLMGMPPLAVVNVDEAVSLGAALAAGKRVQERSPQELAPAASLEITKTRLTDVCNHFFGVLALNRDLASGRITERNCILLRKNTPLPCSQHDVFFTVQARQPMAVIRVTQTANRAVRGALAAQLPAEFSAQGQIHLRLQPAPPL